MYKLYLSYEQHGNVYLLSDNHFGHTNIIKHANRPFSSVEEMDEVMLNNWNSTVGKNDTVINMGDFCWTKNKHVLQKYTEPLNGKKYLKLGNHDPFKPQVYLDAGFERVLEDSITDLTYVSANGDKYKIVLCHYPIYMWDGCFKDSFHLYGHTHLLITNFRNSMNICVENTDYKPLHIEEIIAKLKSGKVC